MPYWVIIGMSLTMPQCLMNNEIHNMCKVYIEHAATKVLLYYLLLDHIYNDADYFATFVNHSSDSYFIWCSISHAQYT